jgi:isopenicillin N synthase-like dioxygenase
VLRTGRSFLADSLVAFYTDDTAKKAVLVQQVRQACLEKGFFQITNHGISEDLQSAIFEQAADFFSLPLEEKMKYDKSKKHNARCFVEVSV